MNLQRTIFSRLYRKAPDVASLPWHHEEPPPMLERALAARPGPGRALDLGCGEGVYAVHLAQQGWSVVGIDFVSAALDAARQRAEAAGVEVELVEGDVSTTVPPSGTTSCSTPAACTTSRRASAPPTVSGSTTGWPPAATWCSSTSRIVPRCPPNGPRHLSLDEAVAFFAPLELRAHDETHFDVPLPMGRMRAGVYWFTRPAA